ncbi:hypothetical protein B0H16DRAFT_1504260 [Mycena metata]|uniref:F-box domain-containing protein n=1 Tax=Mycena metata TaxID=1033252 RepID=A0AAD7NVN0_9AGAR|nr:hypothetical protein B0H16DRAFT_1504260 [Mycena metata]
MMFLSRCSQCGASQGPDRLELDVAGPGTRHHILLNSNEAPVESEVAVIRAELTTSDARLVFLDNEIARLRGQLEQLQEQRTSVWSYRAQNCSILSGLRRIPPEILGYIFSWTLPAIGELLPATESRLTKSPWVLSHVSCYWRAVALSDASLWSLVTVTYDDPRPHDPLSMVETQVGRAQTLKVHFYGCETFDHQPQVEMFLYLARYAPQWEELSVGLTPHLVPLLGILRDRVPLLRRFYVQWQSDSGSTVIPLECFQNAPSLLEARVFSDFRYIPVPFPAHQLTQYQLDFPWETHATILKEAVNLIEARIFVDFQNTEDWRNSRAVLDLTCLRRLFISHPEILEFLRVPVLEEITIDFDEGAGPEILRDLQLVVSRSSCILRRLCLWGFDLWTTTEILRQFPSIVEFPIIATTHSGGELAETLMKRLTVHTDSGSEVMAPQLRCLSFACEYEAFTNHPIYMDMVASRWRTGGLKTSELLVDSGPLPDADVRKSIAVLCEEGLDLVFLEGKDAESAIAGWTFHATWN